MKNEDVALTPPPVAAFSDMDGKHFFYDDDPMACDAYAEEKFAQKSTCTKLLYGLAYTALALVSLYLFMVAIKFLGEGFTLALGCDTKGAFDFANNPVAGLMVGTVTTALLHSSSTVTSITVALVGSGGMTIRQGVYVVMGANVGTCVTCIMVAFSQLGDRAQFRRAMAAATVHNMYNVWSVMVMFPIEVVFHPLEKISVTMSKAKTNGGDFTSPVDAVVNPLADQLLVVNKTAIYDVATGVNKCTSSTTFVTGGGFQNTSLSDTSVGVIVAVLGFLLLVCSLLLFVKMLSKVLMGPTKRIISTILDYNGVVNILVGTVITFAIHSSTVVTSTLTPMAGLGVISLEQVYPLVIGANVGTTGTALLASLVTGKSNAVAIALVHFWFNVFGIVLFYPIPITRKPILSWAASLAFFSASWPMSAVIFLVLLFVVIPAILLGLVYLCIAASTATQITGYVLSGLTALLLVNSISWYKKRGGNEMWYRFLERKRAARDAKRAVENEVSGLV